MEPPHDKLLSGGMIELLHDDDVIRSLATETGPAGEWARLHALARSLPAELPTTSTDVVAALLLMTRDERFEPWLMQLAGDDAHLPTILLALRWLGGEVSDESSLVDAVREHLDGPRGADAACVLAHLGGLRGSDIGPLVARYADHILLPWWVLATGASPDVARDVARHLASKGSVGTESLIETVHWMLGIAPPAKDAVRAWRAAQARYEGVPDLPGRGSDRRRVERWVAQLSAHLQGPLQHVVPAWIAATSERLPPEIAASVFEAAWDPTATPGRTTAPVHVEALDTPAYREWAIADVLRDPNHLATYERGEDERFSLELAGWCPTVGVLEQLLERPVSPDATGELMMALARMGSPATLPVMAVLADRVDVDVAHDAEALTRGLLGRWTT